MLTKTKRIGIMYYTSTWWRNKHRIAWLQFITVKSIEPPEPATVPQPITHFFSCKPTWTHFSHKKYTQNSQPSPFWKYYREECAVPDTQTAHCSSQAAYLRWVTSRWSSSALCTQTHCHDNRQVRMTVGTLISKSSPLHTASHLPWAWH